MFRPLLLLFATQAALGAVVTVDSRVARVAGRVPAMEGEKLVTSHEFAVPVFLTAFEVDIFQVDEQGGPPRQLEGEPFLCHAWLERERGLPPPDENTPITISQGMSREEMPAGYGVLLPSGNVMLSAQVQNDFDLEAPVDFFFRFTMQFVTVSEDAGATQPLYAATFFGKGEAVHPTESAKESKWFVVRPGFRESKTPLRNAFEGSIKVIKSHFHTFGKYIRLRDETAGTLVWEATAEDDASGRAVEHTSGYSSAEGLRLIGNHAYALIHAYDKTTPGDTDGMAVLRVLWAPIQRRAAP